MVAIPFLLALIFKKYMKKITLSVFLLLAFFGGGYIVNAENNDGRKIAPWKVETREDRKELWQENKGEREAWREETKEKREEWKTEMEKNREEWKKKMEENKGDFKKNGRMKIGMAFMSRIEALSRIAEKIENRIEKLEADGQDTGDAQSFVDQAQNSIEDAENKMALVKTAIEAGEEREVIKTKIEAVKTAMKSAHESLKKAVQEIKDNKKEDSE
ncbi:MAG: hypothetical protein QG583_434 [Patescibacteria group bacterium]|nr:hypothetical protein [Patescibacteria group bacterium]